MVISFTIRYKIGVRHMNLTRAVILSSDQKGQVSVPASGEYELINIKGRGRLKILVLNAADGTLAPRIEIDGFERIQLPEVDTLNAYNVENDNGVYWAHDVTGGAEGITLVDIPFQKSLRILLYNSKTSAVATVMWFAVLEMAIATAEQAGIVANPFKPPAVKEKAKRKA